MATPAIHPQTVTNVATVVWCGNAIVALALALHPAASDTLSTVAACVALTALARVIWLVRS